MLGPFCVEQRYLSLQVPSPNECDMVLGFSGVLNPNPRSVFHVGFREETSGKMWKLSAFSHTFQTLKNRLKYYTEVRLTASDAEMFQEITRFLSMLMLNEVFCTESSKKRKNRPKLTQKTAPKVFLCAGHESDVHFSPRLNFWACSWAEFVPEFWGYKYINTVSNLYYNFLAFVTDLRRFLKYFTR